MKETHPSRTWIWRGPFIVWVILLALAAANGFVAHVPLGVANTAIGLTIGAIMAGTIGIFFMRLRRSPGMLCIAALAGLTFLFTLFLLTFGDYINRPHW